MRRFVAHRAKITGSTDQAFPKMVSPQPVYHHPSGKRMIRPNQPIGQRPTPAGRLG